MEFFFQNLKWLRYGPTSQNIACLKDINILVISSWSARLKVRISFVSVNTCLSQLSFNSEPLFVG
jgi:hypothetical protein